MEFLAGADGGRAWADDGGFVSARIDVDVDEYYGDDADASIATLLRRAVDHPVRRLGHASADVGSDLLWRQITEWLSGSITLDQLLVSIDEALEIEPDDTDRTPESHSDCVGK